ncbi:hypothetical protein [Crenobacter luteus]|uniref:hypothetical protein n=1 Tax=Crenobacter luteus TaxID=1452487 RepID=UPI0012E75DCD|nr:hypothetical protein [Crenobacter luteus]
MPQLRRSSLLRKIHDNAILCGKNANKQSGLVNGAMQKTFDIARPPTYHAIVQCNKAVPISNRVVPNK